MSSGEVLRLLTADDAARVWEWRNDPMARQYAPNSGAIPWEAHRRWFTELLVDPARGGWIVESSGEPVAFVRVDTENDVGIIEVIVAPHARRQGFGTRGLQLVARDASRLWDLREVHAHIRPDNTYAELAAQHAGFTLGGLVLYRGVKALQYIWRPDPKGRVARLD